jgi:translation initiation factor IF-1
MSKQDSIKTEGCVTEALGGDRFRVQLDNGAMILGTLSGRMRNQHIRVLVGDRVEVQLSPYDMTRGRISYRFNVKRQRS